MGAYELGATIYVTPTGAGTLTGASWANAATLPHALTIAANVGSQIWVAQGTYTIIITAYCNGKLCKSCTFTFTVACTGVPPKCCPYNITVSNVSTTSTVITSPNATLVNSLFSFNGLTGVPLTEVRAVVQSYTIGSNFNNECLGCKSQPYTWASISAPGNIGIVPPKVTMFGFTAPSFIPTGAGVYQNPREVVWSNGASFSMVNPLLISFYLPPPPVIDCCEFSGTICVKFTFKDDKCRVCEVVACFNFTISNTNPGVFFKPMITKGTGD